MTLGMSSPAAPSSSQTVNTVGKKRSFFREKFNTVRIGGKNLLTWIIEFTDINTISIICYINGFKINKCHLR